MEVLFWLVPAGVATLLAMVVATWTGSRGRREAAHEHRSSPRDDEAARARIGAALARPLPKRAQYVVRRPGERGTGVAIRRSAATAAGSAQGRGRPAPGSDAPRVRN